MKTARIAKIKLICIKFVKQLQDQFDDMTDEEAETETYDSAVAAQEYAADAGAVEERE